MTLHTVYLSGGPYAGTLCNSSLAGVAVVATGSQGRHVYRCDWNSAPWVAWWDFEKTLRDARETLTREVAKHG